ncbi:hypothetical protein V8E55_004291 [Tylopilus felleus]
MVWFRIQRLVAIPLRPLSTTVPLEIDSWLLPLPFRQKTGGVNVDMDRKPYKGWKSEKTLGAMSFWNFMTWKQKGIHALDAKVGSLVIPTTSEPAELVTERSHRSDDLGHINMLVAAAERPEGHNGLFEGGLKKPILFRINMLLRLPKTLSLMVRKVPCARIFKNVSKTVTVVAYQRRGCVPSTVPTRIRECGIFRSKLAVIKRVDRTQAKGVPAAATPYGVPLSENPCPTLTLNNLGSIYLYSRFYHPKCGNSHYAVVIRGSTTHAARFGEMSLARFYAEEATSSYIKNAECHART